jgi:hypothetical protein
MTPFDIDLGMICRRHTAETGARHEEHIVFARYDINTMLIRSKFDGAIYSVSVADFEYFFNDQWSKLGENS